MKPIDAKAFWTAVGQRAMGVSVVTAAGPDGPALCPMVVGPENSDPYPEHWEAIRSLGRHFGLALDPSRCYPYGRR